GTGGSTGGTGGTGGSTGGTGGTGGSTGGTGGTGGSTGGTGGTGGSTGGTGGTGGSTGGTGGSTGGTGGSTGGTGGTGGATGPTLHFYAYKKGAPAGNNGAAAVIRVNPDRTTTVIQTWASLSDWSSVVGVPSPPGTLMFHHRNTDDYAYVNLNQKDGTLVTPWSGQLGWGVGAIMKSAFGGGAVGYTPSSGIARYYVVTSTGAPTSSTAADEPGAGYDVMGATRTGVVVLYKSSDGSGKRGVLNASNKLTWNLTWSPGSWAGGWTHWEPLTGDRAFLYNATTGAVAVVSVPPTAAASTVGTPTGFSPGVTHWVSYESGWLVAYTKGTGAAWLDQTSTSSPYITSVGAITGLTGGWDALVPM
ncbi:MAG: hypothetical protein IT377_14990, partial [Polyangiaceae bacterium]|nr:hypothetical protein [Polyangiaceae bacterium]